MRSVPRFSNRRLLVLILSGILLVGFFIAPLFTLVQYVGAETEGWWNEEWPYRKAITIDHTKVDANQENFPVLINITDSNLAYEAQLDGDDIVFTDGVGNKLYHEIELYNSSSGHLVAWVNVPDLSATTNVKLYMYYGNSDAENQQNPASVWDSNYMMIQHLDEKSGTHYDSTSNGNNGTPYNGVVQGATGILDGADTFDGIDDYVEVPHSNTITGFTVAFTASFWVKLKSVTRRQSILQKYDTTDNQRGWLIEYRTDVGNAIALLASKDGINYKGWYASFNPIKDAWYYLTVVWKSNTIPKFYVNAQLLPTVNTGTIPRIFNNEATPLHVGRNSYAPGRQFKGTIDEIRLSNITRSANWTLTNYNNQKDPSTFYMVGNEETYTGAPSVSDPQPQNGATDVYTNPTLSIRATDMNGDPMTIIFSTNVSGTWEALGTYDNVEDGIYTWVPTSMNKLGATYYWSVSVTDGKSWTNKTYSFTTTTTILKPKWTVRGLPTGSGDVLTYDVNNDGLEEVVYAGGYNGSGSVTLLNGLNGSIIWSVPISGLDEGVQPQMADLTRDGIPEIIVPIAHPSGVCVLFANDGSVYWNVSLSGTTWSAPVVGDIDGDGYPTIFIASSDVEEGLNGSGRITALTHDGRVQQQSFTWRPCGGGLSLADADGDGEFELYMGDRYMYMGSDRDYGKGVQSFWAKNLTLRWEHPDILCSSHIPMLADVNNDGILDVIVGHQRGGIAVLNSTDGSTIKETLGIPDDAPIHTQPSVYDIDNDGNLELLMASAFNYTTNETVIWDLSQWKVDARMSLGLERYGPRVADVDGDGIMEIIACEYTTIFVINSTYSIIAQVSNLTGLLHYAVTQDIDGDGYVELLVSSSYPQLQRAVLYAFDTPARRPNPRPRSEVQFYSERRLGAAEYVPPPGRPEPLVSALSQQDGAVNIPVGLSQLSFNLVDYQHELMNYTVTTYPDIGSSSGVNVGNGRYAVLISNLEYATTYTWKVSVTDGAHWTNKTFTFTTEAISPWWNAKWQYRRTIAINPAKISADQYNFPILIDLTDNSLTSKAQLDGDDFVFISDNESKLNHGIELYDSISGHLVAWVNIPFVSSTTYTRIYMYYGNPDAANQQNPTAVWDTNYKLVLHLDEKTGLHYDSTINGNNGTPHGGIIQGAIGKIDGADRFDGINDYIEVPHSNSIAGFKTALTASFWLKLDDITRRQTILNKYNTLGNQRGWYIEFQNHYKYGKVLAFLISPDGVIYRDYYASFNPVAGEWYYIVVVWESGKIPKFYINGLKTPTIGTAIISSIFNNTGAPLHIGRSTFATGRYLKGGLDEICISNSARSAGWILTSYNNQKDPFSFCNIGSQETIPEEPYLTASSPFNGATNVPTSLSKLSFHIMDYQGDLMNYIVTTFPDIGSDNATDMGNGGYTVSVNNLAYSTLYTWHVDVTDGIHWTNKTFTFTTEPFPSWWSTNWQYRKTITINPAKVGYDQTSFPLLIELTDSDLAQKAQPDGDDIVFTDFNNIQLSHEIELYNSTTGRLVAWVNVPFLSSTAYTRIYMYYGNPSATNQQNPTAVWDTHYKLVLHLDEKTGLHYDSTTNGNNGTPYGGVIQGAIGKIDGADIFDGINDYVKVPHSNTIAGFKTALTASFWLKLDDTTRRQTILNKYDTLGNQRGWYIEFQNHYKYGKVLAFLISPDGVNYLDYYTSFSPTAGEWYYIVVVWESGKVPKFYINGVQALTIGKATMSSIFNNTVAPLHIGRSTFATGRYLKGGLDEICISNSARSAGWILTSYNNQKDPFSFCNIGSQETIPQGPVISIPFPLNGATCVPLPLSQLSFNLVNYQDNMMNYTVATSPDVGSGSGTNVFDGRYSISISSLASSSTYTWIVSATDGTFWTTQTYTFTTFPGAPPTHDTPLLVSSGGANKTDENLICYNQTTYDLEGRKVTNIFNWYKNNSSTTNLLLPFDTNSSTTVKDYSGYNNNGMIVRQVTWTSNGMVGGAYKFDRGFIEIPGTSTLDGGGKWSEITVEHWIYLTTNQFGTRTIAKIPSYEIGLLYGNKIFAGIWIDTGVWNVSGYSRVTSDIALEKNTWYHVAFTYKNGTCLTLYINGIAVATESVSRGCIQTSGDEPLYIGWFDYFKGKIDEVRIYPKSLSPQQIYQRYVETKDGLSNSSTIVQEETEVGDVWKCQVTPSDSYQDGTAKFSNTITIVGNNDTPSADNLTTILPTPYTNDNLVTNYVYYDQTEKTRAIAEALSWVSFLPCSVSREGAYSVINSVGLSFG